MSDVARWWAFVLRYEAREMWRALPGPWWVKVLLIVALSAIPGQFDEVIFLAVLSALRKRRARRELADSLRLDVAPVGFPQGGGVVHAGLGHDGAGFPLALVAHAAKPTGRAPL